MRAEGVEASGPGGVREVALGCFPLSSWRRNWWGVIMPSPRWGPSVLYSLTQALGSSTPSASSIELSNSSPVEELVAHGAVEALDERVLLRAALLDERRFQTPCSTSQSARDSAMNSRPLSERSTPGRPRRSNSRACSATSS